MKRIIYDNTTGEIKSCRSIPDHMLDKNLAKGSNLSYINGSITNVKDYKINLDTSEVEQNIVTTEISVWIRLRRNAKLSASDWTVGPDSPLSDSKKTQWQTYRQALRDMPTTNSSVTLKQDVVWPTQPE